jgi:hypothetical protein
MAAHPLWIPKMCPIKDCQRISTFSTAQALKCHLQVSHKIEDKDTLKQYTYVKELGFLHQQCTFPDYTYTTLYRKKKLLMNYLEKQHSITKEDVIKYIAIR